METIMAGQQAAAPERIVVTADRLGNTGSAAIWLALAQIEADSPQGKTLLAGGPRPPTSCSAGSIVTILISPDRCRGAAAPPRAER